MATKHTPGPWAMHSPTEGNPKTGDGTYCITTDRDGGVLAYIVPKDWHESPAPCSSSLIQSRAKH